MGHRRLTVIDLSEAAAQPMVDERFGLSIVFNGCIYNHHELRAELAGGYPFRSTSDTEVILAAYDRWGEDFVDHLVGMFAIALVDQRRRQVVLARDRLEIKPLYLAEVGGRWRFASTLPALVAAGRVDASIDDVALHHYLSWHSIVPAPRTIPAGVTKLPAATVRAVDVAGRTRDRIYWQPQYTRDPQRSGWSAQNWGDAVHEALRTAVERRLVADVPVRVLLSGGPDSSLIVALLAEAGRQDPPTFSIGFADAGDRAGDEFACSDRVAEVFGTDHHRLRIDTTALAPAVEDTVAVMTGPMASHDVTAFHLLSQAVSAHVQVVQSGQGADEVFAGYGYHQPAAPAERTVALNAFTDAFADHDQAGLLEILEPEWLHPADPSRQLLTDQLTAPGAATALDAVLRLDTHRLKIDDPVKRADNMTMAFGLEARVPFLDQDLVEPAAACPPELTDVLEDLLAAPNARHVPTGPNVLGNRVCWKCGCSATVSGTEPGRTEAPDMPASLLRTWSWQASRSGVEGLLIGPATGTPTPAGDVVDRLLETLRPVLAEDGEEEQVEAVVTHMPRQGTGARHQHRAHAARHELRDVVAAAAETTHRAPVLGPITPTTRHRRPHRGRDRRDGTPPPVGEGRISIAGRQGVQTVQIPGQDTVTPLPWGKRSSSRPRQSLWQGAAPMHRESSVPSRSGSMVIATSARPAA